MSEINTVNDSATERVQQGVVVSSSQNKTIVVEVTTKVKHKKYNKFIKRKTKLHAHDEDNSAKLEDVVIVKHTRPISKKKCWQLVEIVK